MHHSLSAVAATLLTLAGLAGCAGPSTDPPADAAPPAAYVPATITRAEVAPGLYELAYSARRNAVFVASSGGFGDTAAASKILRLDPATLAVQQEIGLSHKGFGVVLDDAADRLYVGHGMDASISVIDTASNQLLDTLQLEEKTVGEDGKASAAHHLRELVLDRDNHRLFAPGLGFEGSVLFVVDTADFSLEKTIEGFGPVATGIALDAEGKRVFVSNFAGEVISVDTGTLEIGKRLATGVEQPLNLAWDAAGKRLFATDQGLEQVRKMLAERQPGYQSQHPGNRLAIIDPETGTVTDSLATGEGPIAVLFDAPRARLYVTNRGGGSVSVFDSTSKALLETITVPTHPNSLALDAASGTVYVSVKNDREAERGAAESVVRLAY